MWLSPSFYWIQALSISSMENQNKQSKPFMLLTKKFNKFSSISTMIISMKKLTIWIISKAYFLIKKLLFPKERTNFLKEKDNKKKMK